MAYVAIVQDTVESVHVEINCTRLASDVCKLRRTHEVISLNINPLTIGAKVSNTSAEVYTSDQVFPAKSAKATLATSGHCGYKEVSVRI